VIVAVEEVEIRIDGHGTWTLYQFKRKSQLRSCLLGLGRCYRALVQEDEVDELGVHAVVRVHGLVGGRLLVAEDLALVHVEGTSTATEANTLRAELSRVADLAP